MTYAKQTTVSVDKSQAEITRTLQRYGADAFGIFHERDRALLQFKFERRAIQIELPLPSRSEPEFTHNSRGARTDDAAFKLWEQACRQRWRALCLVVKAKLEAVESGISTLEREFLAWTVLPSGETVGDALIPAIDRAIECGEPLRLLGGGGA